MKANENSIILNENSITTTIGTTQVVQTADGLTVKIEADDRKAVALGKVSVADHLIVDGNTSDGYHTFNELYEHRTALFAVICRLFSELSWRSCLHSDGTMFDGMFIAGIRTPDGDYSYHCENKYWPMFDQVPELTRAPEWDGHQPKDYDRLFSLKRHELPDFSKLAWNEEE